MKIKDRIIHLLGGYTKAEYEMNNNTNVRIPVILNEKPIKMLKVGYRFNPYLKYTDYQVEKMVKKDLVARIAVKMEEDNLIVFKTDERDPSVIYAMAKVIDMSDATQ